jgi:hypothetical protein
MKGKSMKAKLFVLRAIVLPLLAVSPLTAVSQCITPFEVGDWTNDDPNTGGITRIHIDFSCNDQVLCGVDANGKVTCSTPGPPFQVHLWGKCSPSDCDWGTVSGTDWLAPDGTHWIFAYYNQGFAKRYVYIKPSALFPGHLFMWMFTDFVDPGRSDYVMQNWFHH